MKAKNYKIAFVLGTRPEIIKMAPVIKLCILHKLSFFVIHTGQHYSFEMDQLIFSDLELPNPKYNLEVGSGSHGAQTGKMLEKIEEIILKEKPDILLVQGDTNSVLGGALASVKHHIKVGHIEAGLRSYDRDMPEEINRIVVDHISDYLYVPTEETKRNLEKEGIDSKKIIITGNTIVDSVLQNVQIAQHKSDILKKLNLLHQKYFLLTLHRAENTDSKKRLTEIMKGLNLVIKKYNIPMIWPIHPRTKSKLIEYGMLEKLQDMTMLSMIDPTGFLDTLILESNAVLILTDSGGIQEEACILKVPCVTLRDNTERPESVAVGANFIAGANALTIYNAVSEMIVKTRDWENPFGDGTSSAKILDTLKNLN